MNIVKFLSHPAAQLASFSILLVGSPYFGGPYLYFIYHASAEGYLYAITGIVAMVITAVSLFVHHVKVRGYIQLCGLAVMLVSLAIFFFSSEGFINASTFHDLVPLLSLLFFITVSVLVVRRTVSGYVKQ